MAKILNLDWYRQHKMVGLKKGVQASEHNLENVVGGDTNPNYNRRNLSGNPAAQIDNGTTSHETPYETPIQTKQDPDYSCLSHLPESIAQHFKPYVGTLPEDTMAEVVRMAEEDPLGAIAFASDERDKSRLTEIDNLEEIINKKDAMIEETDKILVESQEQAKRDGFLKSFYNKNASYEVFAKKYINTLMLLKEQGRKSTYVASFFIDIDKLKHANDTMGHVFVDKQVFPAIEQAVNYVISSTMRAGDLVGKQASQESGEISDNIAGDYSPVRYGGDEIFCVAFDLKEKEHVDTIAEKIRSCIESYEFRREEDGKIIHQQTASIGAYVDEVSYDPLNFVVREKMEKLKNIGVNPEISSRTGARGKYSRGFMPEVREEVHEIYMEIAEELNLRGIYNKFLEKADMLVYEAKNNGRNTVVSNL